jgi:hypothetical protein
MSLTRPIWLVVFIALSAMHFIRQDTSVQKGAPSTGVIYVGLVEDDRGQLERLGRWDATPVPGRAVTPAFETTNHGWKPILNLNRRLTWIVAFDGKRVGKVESEPIQRASLEKVNGPSNIHSILTPPAGIPTIGKPDGRFSGNHGRETRRPLVVVSQPNFADPDQWKPRDAPDDVVSHARAKLRTVLNHVRQCDSSNEAVKTDWNYPEAEVRVVKSWGSNKGAFILETKFQHNHCLFNVNGEDYQSLGGNQFFYVTPSHEATFLGLQWELVDAGDYDVDGKSEVIFYVAEGKDFDIEHEGYVLFYDDFRRSVKFIWENH